MANGSQLIAANMSLKLPPTQSLCEMKMGSGGKLGSYLNESGDAASSELDARSEEFEDRS